MKRTDLIVIFLFVVIVIFSFFIINSNQNYVFGQANQCTLNSDCSGLNDLAMCRAGFCLNNACIQRSTCSFPTQCDDKGNCVTTSSSSGSATSSSSSSGVLASSSSSGTSTTISDDCTCKSGFYFNGMDCVFGTLNCLEDINDPVCGCDNMTYENSCKAKASGIKKITKGECKVINVLNCSKDKDCPEGICSRGHTFKKFACVNDECFQLFYENNPCSSSSSSSSSSGTLTEIKISENFSGIWKGRTTRCGLDLVENITSSSGGCIVCPTVQLTCPSKGFVFVPQTCGACAFCQECKISEIGLQLCVKDGVLKGIINLDKVFDRDIIFSQSVTSKNDLVVSLHSKVLDKPFRIRLILKRPNKIVGFVSNEILIKEFKASKFIKSGCPISDLKTECCEGFISSQSEFICPIGFTNSKCLNPAGSNLKNNVCCNNKKDCQIPCGSICCQKGETCTISDICKPQPLTIKGIPVPCFGPLCNVFNPFCFAQPTLTCQNCSPRESCLETSNSKNPCPGGTFCSGSPDFLCYPSGCPISQ